MTQAMSSEKANANDDADDEHPAKKKTKAQLLKAFDESFGLVKDRRGHTPLHYAAFENNFAVGDTAKHWQHTQTSAAHLSAHLSFRTPFAHHCRSNIMLYSRLLTSFTPCKLTWRCWTAKRTRPCT